MVFNILASLITLGFFIPFPDSRDWEDLKEVNWKNVLVGTMIGLAAAGAIAVGVWMWTHR
jgi:hypothetical protein